MSICTVDDDYVRDRMRWVVVLSDNQTVYEDDDRPGLDEPSAWTRLRAYCEAHDTHIEEMWLQFRSNRVLVEPTSAQGYFFVKLAFGVWGDQTTSHAYIVGVWADGVVQATTWKVPELVLIDRQIRHAGLDSPSLILKKEFRSG